MKANVSSKRVKRQLRQGSRAGGRGVMKVMRTRKVEAVCSQECNDSVSAL